MSAPRGDMWRRDPGVPYQTLEEETIVVDPRRREVHLLNETAGQVWRLLATPRSAEELVDALGELYEAPVEDMRVAVARLLAELEGKGLLVST